MKFWTWLRSNPYFVAGWTAFVGAMLPQLTSIQQGKFDFSTGGIEHSLISAGIVGLLAVIHLYTNTPSQAAQVAAQTVLATVAGGSLVNYASQGPVTISSTTVPGVPLSVAGSYDPSAKAKQ